METRIKELLEKKGMSSAELSRRIDVTKATVSNLITGKTSPSVETLMRIAEVLEVPFWQLFTSPDDIIDRKQHVCPHCGKPIDIEVIIK